jgi:Protein of unknown function (DUF3570)
VAVAASSRLPRRPGLAAVFTLAALAGPVPLGSSDDQRPEIGVDFHSFQDSRDVSVQSPSFTLSRDFTDRTGLRASFGVDVISAASDSCVRCHSQGTGNLRAYLGAAVVRKLTNATVSVGGEFSQERFYRSTTILTSGSRSFNKSNTTVAGGFSFSLNRPKLHPRSVSESQTTQNAFVSLTQTLTRTTIAQAGYEFGHIGGYQNDPFLRALVNGQLVLGNHPQDRTRQTLTLGLRQALPAETYLEADYRRYIDDWSVHSNAFSVGVSHQFVRRLLVYLGYRRYDQTGAYFFAPEYLGTPEFFTSDFRLEPFASDLFTGRGDYTPPHGLWFLPQGSRVTLQYDRYASDTDFRAGILTVRLRIPWGRRPGSP